MTTRLMTEAQWRAAMTTAAINDLPDSAFAYIEPGGEKDDSGKTTPRSKRHYPVHDKAHADNALARANAAIAGDNEDAKSIAEKALPAIKTAVKKFADAEESKSALWATEHRDGMSYGDLSDLLGEALAIKYPSEDGWGPWVADFTDEWVIYSCNGETKQISYSVDGTTVTFIGSPIPVTATTTWKPVDITVTTQANSARVNHVRNKKPRHRSGLPNGREVRDGYRHFTVEGIELRDDTEAGTLQLVGKPIQYNTGYQVRDMLGVFEETMHPGVVTDLLSTGQLDCRFLFNHAGLPLGRTLSGTLTLRDTPDYLESTVTLDPRQQLATDLAVAVERGDVSQMSVGMIVGEDKWDARQEHRDIYKLKDLQDVSAVVYPASPSTEIEVAQRMLMDVPIESRERLHKVWSITRDLHDGVVLTPEQVDLLSDAVRALATVEDMEIVEPVEDERSEDADVVSLVTDALTEVERGKRAAGTVEKWAAIADLRLAVIDIFTELRANPTPQDKGIATKIKAAHQAVADAIHAQMNDTDNASDPVDAAVMGALQNAHKALGKATVAQSIDGAPDALRCAACQRDNTADSSFCAGCGAPLNVGGPDGTVGNQQTGGSGNDASGANDASGRTRMTTAELRRRDELARIEREKRARGNAA